MGAACCCERRVGAQQDLRGNLMRKRTQDMDIDSVYSFENELGQGSMGAVAAIRKKDTGQLYALKTIQLTRISQEMVDELLNEINLLMRLDHPNIIRPLELFQRRRQMYFVMEMCEGGDLYERMPYSEKDAALITNQICSAVRYLHDNNVCHRDLKFENILFESRSPEAMVKLIDFGLSKAYKTGKTMNEPVGTLYSMAPEVLKGRYTQACDMWSVGVLAFMLISGEMPFDGRTETQVLVKLEVARYSMSSTAWRGRSDDAKDFVASLIRVAPNKRMTAKAALDHRWLKRAFTHQQTLSSQLSDRDGVGKGFVNSLKQFGQYGKLRKAALMVVAHRAKPEQIEKLRLAFIEIDTAREGFITLQELEHVLLEYGISNQETAEIFAGLDVDRTGKISYTEFLAASMETMGLLQEEQLLEAFDRLDADDTGFISAENLKQILGSMYTPEVVDSMIAEADLKQNGKVDVEEFLHLTRQGHDHEQAAVGAAPKPAAAGTTATEKGAAATAES